MQAKGVDEKEWKSCYKHLVKWRMREELLRDSWMHLRVQVSRAMETQMVMMMMIIMEDQSKTLMTRRNGMMMTANQVLMMTSLTMEINPIPAMLLVCGEGMSGEHPGRSGDDADSDGGNIPQMLQYLKLPDTPKTTSSSISSDAETKNTGTCNEASPLSTPMTIERLNLHDYQEELAKHSLAGKNSVIVAPTGSGKTRVAIAIAINALKEQRGACKTHKKVVFVVNKVALVEQQKNAFQEFIPDVVGISGDMSSQMPLVYYLQQANVIVLTAQILLNALKDDESFSLSLLRLIILDECHNTQKENSYNTIMAYYRDEKKENQATLPQVRMSFSATFFS
ncbi:interferon-induced helicase C domain-containing protein 1 [Strongylocentrotus purpuratus]|uniref:Helicase ATP-binding domain-containing protein n=1 Tax=Strongylocentrotus purpuratus TaxID=7668 RepID=A0A7M7NW18_STRPU|nr:interferon-induced helicase C domain-containing protein 1 [Strongylocentrotus purpuratus]